MNAQDLVRAAEEARELRIKYEHPHDWTDHDAYVRFIRVLRSVTFTVQGPHTVVASVEATRDGKTWSYVASELLDSAAAELSFPASTHITSITFGAVINW